MTNIDIIVNNEEMNSIKPPTSPNKSINFVLDLFIVKTLAANWIVTSQTG